MGSNRWSLLFRPGTYGSATEPLQIKVGYYTEVAGLGDEPGDVVINGKVEVYNRCLNDGGTSNCIALNNFWRTLSNLTISVNSLGQDGCRASANFWAVSQAVSMRRVAISGANLSLMDYCTAGPQYASGGFIADSRLPFVINGSQQQWLIRNSEIGGWSNGVWNQVFSGVVGAPDESGFPSPPYTTLDETPVSREKPYLYVDDAGEWFVRVPAASTGTRGVTWANGPQSCVRMDVTTGDSDPGNMRRALTEWSTKFDGKVSMQPDAKRPGKQVVRLDVCSQQSDGGGSGSTTTSIPASPGQPGRGSSTIPSPF